MCVENVANKDTKELLPPEARVGDRIAKHAQERGALVRPIGHLNVLSPPLIMTTDQVDFLVSTLRTSIEATQDDLIREGIWNG
jgi:adenosylmethionine-8-amino-7-oxononanoate aminotransferase